jgi:wyosine [tRNA(Phe)-imidazoG37] synthetase (radical SAM superfamily)
MISPAAIESGFDLGKGFSEPDGQLMKTLVTTTERGVPVRTPICFQEYLSNRFVYLKVSSRARGLSVEINMNPDKRCNFDCVYCEVDRTRPGRAAALELEPLAVELEETLDYVHSGRICDHPAFGQLPSEWLALRQVALSGDGEPTLCPEFGSVVESVIHLRALRKFPFFKIVLLTNAAETDQGGIGEALKMFTSRDEIWAKLDAGTQDSMDRINRTEVRLETVLNNILSIGRKHPVVIQSLFPLLNGREPSAEEINQYCQRLIELRDAGAQISLVQIYSASMPPHYRGCGHLSLRSLSHIAKTVRTQTGLKAEFF